jgi:hypothetical protein
LADLICFMGFSWVWPSFSCIFISLRDSLASKNNFSKRFEAKVPKDQNSKLYHLLLDSPPETFISTFDIQFYLSSLRLMTFSILWHRKIFKKVFQFDMEPRQFEMFRSQWHSV